MGLHAKGSRVSDAHRVQWGNLGASRLLRAAIAAILAAALASSAAPGLFAVAPTDGTTSIAYAAEGDGAAEGSAGAQAPSGEARSVTAGDGQTEAAGDGQTEAAGDGQPEAAGDGQTGATGAQTAAATLSEGVYASYVSQDFSTQPQVDVSADGDAARIEGAAFAAADFYRAQVGSNRAIDGTYYGYAYHLDAAGQVTAVNTDSYAMVYVPADLAKRYSIDVSNPDDQRLLRAYLTALDEGQAKGNSRLSRRDLWYFTDKPTATVDNAVFTFDRELKQDSYYITVSYADDALGVPAGSVDEDAPSIADVLGLSNMDTMNLVASEEAVIVGEGTPLEQLGEFLTTMDYSPLWVTLKTSGTAIIFVFILGLAAAYFTMRISKRAQDIFDTIFTIPMVLPPTVCGFLLLMLLGRNTAFGRFFIDIGFPLAFSWQATVIASVVVAFPLMYRSARGAFENLDPNMMDAARTLGWSNVKIFFKLMLPLAWSSIAAGTVLAFARALGEFGCTLFLAGNQLGTTRTIPIAIYFEWMNGNQDATWFWTITLIVFSFVVILFINLWSRHTTKYRRGAQDESPKLRRKGGRGRGGAPRKGDDGKAGGSEEGRSAYAAVSEENHGAYDAVSEEGRSAYAAVGNGEGPSAAGEGETLWEGGAR